jgi:hypothetical protein
VWGEKGEKGFTGETCDDDAKHPGAWRNFLTTTPSQCSAESVPHSQTHLEIDGGGEQKDLDCIYQAFPLSHVHHIW